MPQQNQPSQSSLSTTNISLELLSRYELPIVASVLKLYLLELPDSLVSSSLYEIIKTIYSTPATSDASSPDSSSQTTATRISVLQNTLGQLRLANIASLDALSTHFARLIDLTSADEDYVQKLTASLAPCILRTRTESALQFEEKYNVRFLRDLLAHKDAIFGELKRASSLTHSASVVRAQSTVNPPHPNVCIPGPGGALPPSLASARNDDNRPRAISTDESNRRANMEERNRAIANRSRAASPARAEQASGPVRNPRRDSSRGPETRFPVHPAGHVSKDSTTMGVGSPRGREGKHTSLEVPGSPPAIATAPSSGAAPPAARAEPEHHAQAPKHNQNHNHTAAGSEEAAMSSPEGSASTPAASSAKPLPDAPADIEKRNSLGRRYAARSGAYGSGGGGAAKRESYGKRDSGGSAFSGGRASLEGGHHRPVELVDKPMDD